MISSTSLSATPILGIEEPPQRLRRMLCNQYLTSIPQWQKAAAVSGVAGMLMVTALITVPSPKPNYNIAFVGNSMQYYNDFPRFMQALSGDHITQDCCLHGDAAFNTILTWGSGMYQIWHTGVARITNDKGAVLYDMGSCTVEQLLFGYDKNLEYKVSQYQAGNNNDGNDNADDDSYEAKNNDDFMTYYDTKNPCLQNSNYYYYKQQVFESEGVAPWDFVVMNDRSRSPARGVPRNISLAVLQDTYLPWFQETGATPVFIVTYGYDTPYRDMSGLIDVPTFTSLTYEGYKQYATLLSSQLPPSQKPRLAPVGLAFLMVYEENRNLWEKLFHIDQIHPSPHGTFLQGCVVHYAIFGRLPSKDIALIDNMSSLWNSARRMQPRKHRRMPMPTREEAEYLYHIAERITIQKQWPKTFIKYKHGEASDYVPNDSMYADNDIYRL